MTSVLGVLDQSPISEGSTGGDALRNSIDLAQLARWTLSRRIDLGLGRAAGTDPPATLALQRDRRQAAPEIVRVRVLLPDDVTARVELRETAAAV